MAISFCEGNTSLKITFQKPNVISLFIIFLNEAQICMFNKVIRFVRVV